MDTADRIEPPQEKELEESHATSALKYHKMRNDSTKIPAMDHQLD